MLTLLYGLSIATGCTAPRWCTCLPPQEPRTHAEARQYIERAEMVFVGTVLRIETPVRQLRRASAPGPDWDHEIVTVVVRERWRGASADTLTLHNSSQPSMCGVELEVGGDYFILASPREAADSTARAPLIPWGCDQSRPATKARRIRRLLGRPLAR
jgi:hypothetical protein